MSRMKLEDFSPALQAQIRAKLAEYTKPVTQLPADPIPSLSPAGGRQSPGPNKTEADYHRYHLRGQDARYEAMTFRMTNGHRYTPDWIVFQDGRPVACHECKGAYALHSQQRARLAFDQARVEFPGLKWVWAVKTTEGWRIQDA
jgi:hypothetical protein